MGTDSNHCGFNKKQRRMAYQSSPKKKQRTITGDGSTGIAIRMGNNSTGNVSSSVGADVSCFVSHFPVIG